MINISSISIIYRAGPRVLRRERLHMELDWLTSSHSASIRLVLSSDCNRKKKFARLQCCSFFSFSFGIRMHIGLSL